METTASPGTINETKWGPNSVCLRQRALCAKLGKVFEDQDEAMSIVADDCCISTGLPFLPVIRSKSELQSVLQKVNRGFKSIEFTLDDFCCNEASNLFTSKVTFSAVVQDRGVFSLPPSAEAKVISISGAIHAKANETDMALKRVDLFLEAFALRQLGISLDSLATPSPGNEAAAAGLR